MGKFLLRQSLFIGTREFRSQDTPIWTFSTVSLGFSCWESGMPEHLWWERGFKKTINVCGGLILVGGRHGIAPKFEVARILTKNGCK